MNSDTARRFISLLTRDTLALVLAGGRGTRLGGLTRHRVKPAVPFGGRYRLIDFPLSNCVNSGIRRIGVLTQYKAYSLIRHLDRGWAFLRGRELGEFLELWPAQQRTGGDWYKGTADAVYQNLEIVRSHDPHFVLVLGGDHVYKMDYGNLLAFHVAREASVTVACMQVPRAEASAFGVMAVDEDGCILEFLEKPTDPPSIPGQPEYALVSMGIYAFNADYLSRSLERDSIDESSSHDFGHDVIPQAVQAGVAYAHTFRDPRSGQLSYWRDVGTIDAYWAANLELTQSTSQLDLYDRNWPILSYQLPGPPAKFTAAGGIAESRVVDSLVAANSILAGAHVTQSVVFPRTRVLARSEVKQSVLLHNVEIGEGVKLYRAVVDTGSRIPAGLEVGYDPDVDRQRFEVSSGGVVLITPDMLGQAPWYQD